MTRRIYLSGPIAGNTYKEVTGWRQRLTDEFEDNYDVEVLDPMRDKFSEANTIINVTPASINAEDETLLSDRGIVVRDHNDTINADILIVNLLGSQDKSIGTVAEMAWAWDRQIPIVTIMESGNIHDHPFIRTMTSYRVDSIERALVVVKSVLNLKTWEDDL
jgi:nucleoside 2-deoxyribosyltransferase